MGVRRQAREAAVQSLYMCDFLATWELSAVEFCFDHFQVNKPPREFALMLSGGVINNLSKIDASITRASENWSLSRMARVDRAILRVATFELAFLSDVPVNVAINEAIEIAKRFGSDESPTFINGVLDKVASLVRSKLRVEVLSEPLPAEDTLEDAGISVSSDSAHIASLKTS